MTPPLYTPQATIEWLHRADFFLSANSKPIVSLELDRKKLGLCLQRLRLECSLTVAEVSLELHIPHATLNHYESGHRKPSRERLALLLAFYIPQVIPTEDLLDNQKIHSKLRS